MSGGSRAVHALSVARNKLRVGCGPWAARAGCPWSARTRHNAGMLIIIIAWLYVVILMSMTEHSVIAGVMTFLLYGVLPLSVVVYLLNTPARRARRKAAQAQEEAAAATEDAEGSDR